MGTIQQTVDSIEMEIPAKKGEWVHRFFEWCQGQEKNRLGWLAGILAGHGCVITPLVLCIVALTGNNFIYWPFIIAAMGMCLVTNLAAMPTKITIPIFLFSMLIDLGIVINALSMSAG